VCAPVRLVVRRGPPAAIGAGLGTTFRRIIGQLTPDVIAPWYKTNKARHTNNKARIIDPGLWYLVAGTGFEPVTFGL